MKRLMFLISLICVVAIKSLVAQSSQITIFHQDGERFWVIIDGVKQNAQPQASVFLSDVKPEFLRVKIIFENEKIADINQSLQTRDVDENYTHTKYIIKLAKKKTVMRFHSYEVLKTDLEITRAQPEPNKIGVPEPVVAVPVIVEPQSTTTTTTTITTQAVETKPTSETIGVGIQVTDPITGQPVGMDVNIKIPTSETGEFDMSTTTKTPEGNFNSSTQVTTTQTTVTTTQTVKEPQTQTAIVAKPVERQPAVNVVVPAEKPSAYEMPGYNGKIGCPWPMVEQDFASAKQSISSKSFEDSKLTIAKQIISNNCLLCSQIKEIMGLFTFEDSKLEFAKYAYGYVYDLNNYYKLNDAFTFESSIDELDEYIRAQTQRR